jgi:Rab GTPase-binding effector protein 1
MQLLVLKYREELITAKVGQEHQENLLKSEIMFLRDQLVAEQQERCTMEENLAQEISHLQQQLGLFVCLFVCSQ